MKRQSALVRAIFNLQIGDRVKYLTLDGDIAESEVVRLIRDKLARIVGFYPLRTDNGDPNLGVTLDRIVAVSPREW